MAGKLAGILTYFQRKIKKILIPDYAGNFGVVKRCSLGRIVGNKNCALKGF